MEKQLNIRIGHLKIIDHLILGVSVCRLQSDGAPLHHACLESVPMNSWEQMCDRLRSGQIHGAFITAPLAMDLFAAGLDLCFLMFAHRSGSVMVKNKNASIKTLDHLKGKTILIPHELSVQHLLLHKLLSAADLKFNAPDSPADPDSILMETASPFLMPQMMAADQDQDIGAYMAPEPYASQAVAKGVAERLCTSDSLWKEHPCCGFVVQAGLCTSHGTAVEELVGHFFQSARLLDARTDDGLVACAQAFLGQEPGIVRQALFNSGICFTPHKLLPDKEKLDIIQTYMTHTMGVMPQAIDLDAFINPACAIKAISGMNL